MNVDLVRHTPELKPIELDSPGGVWYLRPTVSSTTPAREGRYMNHELAVHNAPSFQQYEFSAGRAKPLEQLLLV